MAVKPYTKESSGRVYEFGPFRLDEQEHLLLKDEQPIALTPKVFDTLLLLVERSGRLVDKEELMRTIWPDSFVEEVNLNRSISTLRKVLGEAPNQPRYIETVPKHGYRFIAPVIVVERREGAEVSAQPTLAVLGAEAGEAYAASPPSLDEPRDTIAPGSVDPRKSGQAPGLSRRLTVLLAVILLALTALTYFALKSRTEQNPHAVNAETVHSLAVLPFKVLGATEDEQYLELGMADVLITTLSNLKEINVRPTSAVLKYSNTEQPLVEIGRALKVDAVLEGSVQKIGDRVRVTVRLFDVDRQSPLWAGKFDEQATDLLNVQDAIAERVAGAITANLHGEEQELRIKHYTDNAEAYQFYLKGRFFWNKRTLAGLQRSIDFFRQAITIDPAYALAYAGLADAYSLLVWQTEFSQDTVNKAEEAATRALELDDTLAESHASLAFLRFWYQRDYSGAEAEFRRAITLNPNYATAHHWYAEFLVVMGRFEEGFAELRLALQADPLSLIINADMGKMLFFAHKADQAIEQLQQMLDMEPQFPNGHLFLSMAYNLKGMPEKAIEELLKEPNMGSRPIFKAMLGYSYAHAGRRPEAVSTLNELKRPASRSSVSAFEIALIYVGLGENDQALEWLEKAESEHEPFLIYINVDPNFDTLRNDPRFRRLLQRIHFAD